MRTPVRKVVEIDIDRITVDGVLYKRIKCVGPDGQYDTATRRSYMRRYRANRKCAALSNQTHKQNKTTCSEK